MRLLARVDRGEPISASHANAQADAIDEIRRAAPIWLRRRDAGRVRPRLVVVGGVVWRRDQWTGEPSRYLAVYFDPSRPPQYIDRATFEAALEDGMPDDCEYFALGRTYGDIHIPRV